MAKTELEQKLLASIAKIEALLETNPSDDDDALRAVLAMIVRMLEDDRITPALVYGH